MSMAPVTLVLLLAQGLVGTLAQSTAAVVNASVLGFTLSNQTTFNVFCGRLTEQNCLHTPLRHCAECSMVGGVAFVVVIALIALTIVVGNSLVICFFATGRSTFTGTYGTIKVSLAVADVLTGLMIFFVALPEFANSSHMSVYDTWLYILALHDTSRAKVAGIYHLLVFGSSLYHLALLAQQRFYAVKWPLKYQQQSRKVVYAEIAAVWLISLLLALTPLWFPDVYSFEYRHVIYLFSFEGTGDPVSHLVIVILNCILPFTVMTCITVATGIILSYSLKTSKSNRKESNKREVMMFATLVIMQLGFTATTVPLMVVTSIEGHVGSLNLPIDALPLVIAFYLAMLNSLVNVLVYSFMDVKFRQSVKDFFCCCCCKASSKAPGRNHTLSVRSSTL